MSSISRKLQLTMAILKPHLVANPVALQEVKNMILTSNFKVVKCKQTALSQKGAEDFYAEHQGKFFYNRLVTFMSSGKCQFYILARENAIGEWRKLMGPTKVYKTQFDAPNTIRGKYGLSDTRNASHGSDSAQSAHREIKLFFPEFNIEDWYENDEVHFRHNKLIFLEHEFVHVVDNSCR